MRKRNSISTRFVFGITVLCGTLTVQIAWAANWTITVPPDMSARTKTANVAGGGMTNAADGTVASFEFGHIDPASGFVAENTMTVTANLWSWGGTLNPPPTSGVWNVSPKDAKGNYLGDHVARIDWGPGNNNTVGHIVTD